ncbi:PREDICTED: aminopeptidase N-like [Dinoponera quadriceps]|uniref:Aminopeptidase N-like n=1 Tax=Dinoponera quadriceps TaxID=609295 RepID=A0A6P3Y2V8_DINQU|nr:PREDICTED: aminopeptidase N-like [Dinoponera quadriceps]
MRFNTFPHTDQGLVVTSNDMITDEKTYITIFEPIGARRVFPCWDEPKFKATFNISVVHSSSVQLFSSTTHKEKNILPERGMMQMIFEPSPVMSTYLVTIAITEASLYLAEKGNFKLWGRLLEQDLRLDPNDIIERIAVLTDKFLKKYTNNLWRNMIISILLYPNLPSNAVGAWGFTAFRESDLIYKPDLHFPGRELEIWNMVARQMTRQCIESFVSPMEWSHQWLSHALATFLSYKIAKKEYGEDVMMQLFVVQVLQPALHNDIEMNVPPVMHKYDPIYSSLIYKKASAMIRMLQYIVTEEVLQQGFAQYLNTYAYSSATPNDFFNILNNEMIRSYINCNCNITEVMHIWLLQRRYPTLLVEENDGGMSVKSYDNKDSQGQNKWPIPVIFATESQFRFGRDLSALWLDNNLLQNAKSSLDINVYSREDLVIFNVEQFGYYRVHYQENWKKIANYLNNNDHTKIHVLNRAQIIDDAYHFLMQGEISSSLFCDLIDFLRKETNYIVWHSMMNVLQYISPFFNFPESQQFKEYMLRIMDKVLTIIGYDENSKDDDMLKATRLLLLNWVCKHGHAKCRTMAYDKLVAYVKDPGNNPILPGWRDWTFCAGIMNYNIQNWSEVMLNIMKGNNEMLKHMACAENDHLLLLYLDLTISKPHGKWEKLGIEPMKKLYHDIVKRHARKNQVLDYILSILHKIEHGMTKIQEIADIIMSLYSKCQLDMVTKYVENNTSLDLKATNQIKNMINFRQKQINKQRSIFVNFFHTVLPNKC